MINMIFNLIYIIKYLLQVFVFIIYINNLLKILFILLIYHIYDIMNKNLL